MSSERIPVSPDVLQWARSSAGLAPDLAAKRLAVKEETLARWEAGALLPTITQLRKAGKVYGRPLAVLLLPTPPRDYQPIRDFRRGSEGLLAEWSPALHKEMKRALSQREVVQEIAEISPGAVSEPVQLPLVTVQTDAETVASALREWLELDRVPSAVRSQPQRLLNAVIRAVEARGVLVLQTQGVELREVRGFSITETPSVVVLNGKDWARPRLFTLLHELCHLATNLSGLCDLHEDRRVETERDEIERYCNQVAAAALAPREQVFSIQAVASAGASKRWTLEELEGVSRPFGASSEAMLLRLISLGKADWDTYYLRKPEFEHQYEDARQRERERRRAAEGGPSYYVVKARDLGHGYIATVLDAYEQRAISSLDAADYLEVRFDQISKLEEAAR